jgi:hypothetical protein
MMSCSWNQVVEMTSALPPQYPANCLRESRGALVACQRLYHGIHSTELWNRDTFTQRESA